MVGDKLYTSRTGGIDFIPTEAKDYPISSPAHAGYVLNGTLSITVSDASASTSVPTSTTSTANKTPAQLDLTKIEFHPLEDIDGLSDLCSQLKFNSGSIHSVANLGKDGGCAWGKPRQNAVADSALGNMVTAGLMTPEEADAVKTGAWNGETELNGRAKQQLAIFKFLFAYEATRGGSYASKLITALTDNFNVNNLDTDGKKLDALVVMLQKGQDRDGIVGLMANMRVSSKIDNYAAKERGQKRFWGEGAKDFSKDAPTEQAEVEVTPPGSPAGGSPTQTTKYQQFYQVNSPAINEILGIANEISPSANLTTPAEQEQFITAICKDTNTLDATRLQSAAEFLSLPSVQDRLRIFIGNSPLTGDIVAIYTPKIYTSTDTQAKTDRVTQVDSELNTVVSAKIPTTGNLSLLEMAFKPTTIGGLNQVYIKLYTVADKDDLRAATRAEVNEILTEVGDTKFTSEDAALQAIESAKKTILSRTADAAWDKTPAGAYWASKKSGYVARLTALFNGSNANADANAAANADASAVYTPIIQMLNTTGSPRELLAALKEKISSARIKIPPGVNVDTFAIWYFEAALRVLENNNEPKLWSAMKEAITQTDSVADNTSLAQFFVNGTDENGVIHTSLFTWNIKIRKDALALMDGASPTVPKPVIPVDGGVATYMPTSGDTGTTATTADQTLATLPPTGITFVDQFKDTSEMKQAYSAIPDDKRGAFITYLEENRNTLNFYGPHASNAQEAARLLTVTYGNYTEYTAANSSSD